MQNIAPSSDGHRQEQPGRVERVARHHHDEEERDDREDEVDQSDPDRGHDEDRARDVDAARGLRRVDGEGGRVARRLGEEVPEEHPPEEVDREVLDPLAEDHREDDGQRDHVQQRVQHRPRHAEDRPLVPDRDVAGDQLADEVAVLPERPRLGEERGLERAPSRRRGRQREGPSVREESFVIWRRTEDPRSPRDHEPIFSHRGRRLPAGGPSAPPGGRSR